MEGQCLCAAVRFEIPNELPAMYQCHCTLCQKQSGTASNAATLVEVDKFKWLSGKDNITQWKKDTGFNSHFCRTCGAPVPNPILEQKYMWIPIGVLDLSQQTNPPVVKVNLCLNTKAPWIDKPESDKVYEDMPPDVYDFAKYLQNALDK